MNQHDIIDGFLEFLRNTAPAGEVGPILRRYQDHLEATLSPEDAEAAMAVSLRHMNQSTEVWPIMFDLIYSSGQVTFRAEPNELLTRAIEGLEPGTAIDVAMGQGRNAVYLATKGWAVTGVDISPVGVESAAVEAQARGTSIDATCADIFNYDYGDGVWDLMVFTYTPVHLDDPDVVAGIRRGLKSQGLVVIESFVSLVDTPMRRPVDIDPDELRRVWSEFDFPIFEDVDAIPDWDHEPRRVIRAVATKT
ncbi:MAG: class I SAM-dependent methyltransferase [Acidimicrobiia bacterium]